MRMDRGCAWLLSVVLLLVGLPTAHAQEAITITALAASAAAPAQQPAQPGPTLEIYRFAMLDIGHDFKQIDPNWFDTIRVT